MSVYRISNRLLDRYDPFWICRAVSLKIGTVTILLCLCNAFLKSPQTPMVYMLTTVLATAATEVLPLGSKAKKVAVFFLLLFLLSTSGTLIGLFSYFKVPLFLLMMAFSYFVLRFMATNPKAAVVPSMMILWAVIALEGGAATDLNAIANNYIYYLEFGLMGLITVLFFPDFTPNVFKSALIRILEADIDSLGTRNFKNGDPRVLSALYIIHAKLPFLPPAYQTLYETIIRFQNAFVKSPTLTPEDRALTKSVLSELIKAINQETTFSMVSESSKKIKETNSAAYGTISQLVEGYNLCKA